MHISFYVFPKLCHLKVIDSMVLIFFGIEMLDSRFNAHSSQLRGTTKNGITSAKMLNFYYIIVYLVAILLIIHIPEIDGFGIKGMGEGHGYITSRVLKDFSYPLQDGTDIVFDQSTIDRIVNFVKAVDGWGYSYNLHILSVFREAQTHPERHFDEEQFPAAANRLQQLLDEMVSLLTQEYVNNDEDAEICQTVQARLGQSFHTIQDFYAHSTYVELTDGDNDAGNLIEYGATQTQKTWAPGILRPCPISSDTRDIAVHTLTSGYFDWTDYCKDYTTESDPSGQDLPVNQPKDPNQWQDPTSYEKCRHGLGKCGGINKDYYDRPNYYKAESMAIRASTSHLQLLIQKLTEINIESGQPTALEGQLLCLTGQPVSVGFVSQIYYDNVAGWTAIYDDSYMNQITNLVYDLGEDIYNNVYLGDLTPSGTGSSWSYLPDIDPQSSVTNPRPQINFYTLFFDDICVDDVKSTKNYKEIPNMLFPPDLITIFSNSLGNDLSIKHPMHCDFDIRPSTSMSSGSTVHKNFNYWSEYVSFVSSNKESLYLIDDGHAVLGAGESCTFDRTTTCPGLGSIDGPFGGTDACHASARCRVERYWTDSSCHVRSNRALLKMIDRLPRNSIIYLIAKGSANDDELSADVKSARQSKNIRIIPYIMGSCSPIDNSYIQFGESSGANIIFVPVNNITNSNQSTNLLTQKASLMSNPSSIIIARHNVKLSVPEIPVSSSSALRTVLGEPNPDDVRRYSIEVSFTIAVDATIQLLQISIFSSLRQDLDICYIDALGQISNVLTLQGTVSAFVNQSTPLRVNITLAQSNDSSVLSMFPALGGTYIINGTALGELDIEARASSRFLLSNVRFIETRGRPGHEGDFDIMNSLVSGDTVNIQAELTVENVYLSINLTLNQSTAAQEWLDQIRPIFSIVSISGLPISIANPVLTDSNQTIILPGVVKYIYTLVASVPAEPFRIQASGTVTSQPIPGQRFQRIYDVVYQPTIAKIMMMPEPILSLPMGAVTRLSFNITNKGGAAMGYTVNVQTDPQVSLIIYEQVTNSFTNRQEWKKDISFGNMIVWLQPQETSVFAVDLPVFVGGSFTRSANNISTSNLYAPWNETIEIPFALIISATPIDTSYVRSEIRLPIEAFECPFAVVHNEVLSDSLKKNACNNHWICDFSILSPTLTDPNTNISTICRCAEGWTGDYCEKAVCSEQCGTRGLCISQSPQNLGPDQSTAQLICGSEYVIGPQCHQLYPGDICTSSPGRQGCIPASLAKCFCDPGFYGPKCNQSAQINSMIVNRPIDNTYQLYDTILMEYTIPHELDIIQLYGFLVPINEADFYSLYTEACESITCIPLDQMKNDVRIELTQQTQQFADDISNLTFIIRTKVTYQTLNRGVSNIIDLKDGTFIWLNQSVISIITQYMFSTVPFFYFNTTLSQIAPVFNISVSLIDEHGVLEVPMENTYLIVESSVAAPTFQLAVVTFTDFNDDPGLSYPPRPPPPGSLYFGCTTLVNLNMTYRRRTPSRCIVGQVSLSNYSVTYRFALGLSTTIQPSYDILIDGLSWAYSRPFTIISKKNELGRFIWPWSTTQEMEQFPPESRPSLALSTIFKFPVGDTIIIPFAVKNMPTGNAQLLVYLRNQTGYRSVVQRIWGGVGGTQVLTASLNEAVISLYTYDLYPEVGKNYTLEVVLSYVTDYGMSVENLVSCSGNFTVYMSVPLVTQMNASQPLIDLAPEVILHDGMVYRSNTINFIVNLTTARQVFDYHTLMIVYKIDNHDWATNWNPNIYYIDLLNNNDTVRWEFGSINSAAENVILNNAGGIISIGLAAACASVYSTALESDGFRCYEPVSTNNYTPTLWHVNDPTLWSTNDTSKPWVFIRNSSIVRYSGPTPYFNILPYNAQSQYTMCTMGEWYFQIDGDEVAFDNLNAYHYLWTTPSFTSLDNPDLNFNMYEYVEIGLNGRGIPFFLRPWLLNSSNPVIDGESLYRVNWTVVRYRSYDTFLQPYSSQVFTLLPASVDSLERSLLLHNNITDDGGAISATFEWNKCLLPFSPIDGLPLIEIVLEADVNGPSIGEAHLLMYSEIYQDYNYLQNPNEYNTADVIFQLSNIGNPLAPGSRILTRIRLTFYTPIGVTGVESNKSVTVISSNTLTIRSKTLSLPQPILAMKYLHPSPFPEILRICDNLGHSTVSILVTVTDIYNIYLLQVSKGNMTDEECGHEARSSSTDWLSLPQISDTLPVINDDNEFENRGHYDDIGDFSMAGLWIRMTAVINLDSLTSKLTSGQKSANYYSLVTKRVATNDTIYSSSFLVEPVLDGPQISVIQPSRNSLSSLCENNYTITVEYVLLPSVTTNQSWPLATMVSLDLIDALTNETILHLGEATSQSAFVISLTVELLTPLIYGNSYKLKVSSACNPDYYGLSDAMPFILDLIKIDQPSMYSQYSINSSITLVVRSTTKNDQSCFIPQSIEPGNGTADDVRQVNVFMVDLDTGDQFKISDNITWSDDQHAHFSFNLSEWDAQLNINDRYLIHLVLPHQANYAINSSRFVLLRSIVGTRPSRLQLLSPIGAIDPQSGDNFNISWIFNGPIGFLAIRIQLSIYVNGTANSSILVEPAAIASYGYYWWIPSEVDRPQCNLTNVLCLIEISSATDPSVKDNSILAVNRTWILEPESDVIRKYRNSSSLLSTGQSQPSIIGLSSSSSTTQLGLSSSLLSTAQSQSSATGLGSSSSSSTTQLGFSSSLLSTGHSQGSSSSTIQLGLSSSLLSTGQSQSSTTGQGSSSSTTQLGLSSSLLSTGQSQSSTTGLGSSSLTAQLGVSSSLLSTGQSQSSTTGLGSSSSITQLGLSSSLLSAEQSRSSITGLGSSSSTAQLGVSSSLLSAAQSRSSTGYNPVSSSSTAQSSDPSSSSISTGAIVGIVVGGVIGVVLLGILLLCLCGSVRKRRQSLPPPDTTIQMSSLGAQIEIPSPPLSPKVL